MLSFGTIARIPPPEPTFQFEFIHPPPEPHASILFPYGHSNSGQGLSGRHSQAADADIELKELPPRRKLDAGFGVDPGGPDGPTLERIHVPIYYELVGGLDDR